MTHVHEDEAEHHPVIPEDQFRRWRNGKGGDAVGTMIFLNGDRFVGGWQEQSLCAPIAFSAHSTFIYTDHSLRSNSLSTHFNLLTVMIRCTVLTLLCLFSRP